MDKPRIFLGSSGSLLELAHEVDFAALVRRILGMRRTFILWRADPEDLGIWTGGTIGVARN
jgi:hypothetical protein